MDLPSLNGFTVTPLQTVKVVVKKNDNWIGVVVNGDLILASAYNRDPVPVTKGLSLKKGANDISIIGVDWGVKAELYVELLVTESGKPDQVFSGLHVSKGTRGVSEHHSYVEVTKL